jgi:hypothetical protein
MSPPRGFVSCFEYYQNVIPSDNVIKLRLFGLVRTCLCPSANSATNGRKPRRAADVGACLTAVRSAPTSPKAAELNDIALRG